MATRHPGCAAPTHPPTGPTWCPAWITTARAWQIRPHARAPSRARARPRSAAPPRPRSSWVASPSEVPMAARCTRGRSRPSHLFLPSRPSHPSRPSLKWRGRWSSHRCPSPPRITPHRRGRTSSPRCRGRAGRERGPRRAQQSGYCRARWNGLWRRWRVSGSSMRCTSCSRGRRHRSTGLRRYATVVRVSCGEDALQSFWCVAICALSTGSYLIYMFSVVLLI